MNDNREQFERLLSERADGVLTSVQLAELDRAIAGDAGLADQVRGYERLGALLRRWRAIPINIDWQSLSARISRSVVDEVGLSASAAIDETIDPRLETQCAKPIHPGVEPVRRELQAIDDLVQDAFGPMPEVDWSQLQARISAAVREEAAAQQVAATRMTRRSWSRTARRMAMVGAPLAAAAVIALAIGLPRSTAPIVPAPPSKSMVVVSFETPEPAGHVKIAFEEKPYKGDPVEDEANGAAIANGPAQAGTRERVEEVVLY